MGKMIYALLLIIVFQVAAILFFGVDESPLSLYLAMANPEQWSALGFIDYLTGTLAGVGAILAVSGIIFGRVELIYLGIAANFIGFGFGYVELYQKVLGSHATSVLFGGNEAFFVPLLFVPVLMGWWILILEFARSRD